MVDRPNDLLWCLPAIFAKDGALFMSRLSGTSILARATGLLCLAGVVGIGASMPDARAQTESNGGMTQEESQQYRDCIKLAQLKPEAQDHLYNIIVSQSSLKIK